MNTILVARDTNEAGGATVLQKSAESYTHITTE